MLYRSFYTQHLVTNRVLRVSKGSHLKHLGVLSATGISLIVYNFEDSKRFFSSPKIKCDSSKDFPFSASDAPVVVEKAADEVKSKAKGWWNLGASTGETGSEDHEAEDVKSTSKGWWKSGLGAEDSRAKDQKSGEQDPPSQRKNVEDEKAKPEVSKSRLYFSWMFWVSTCSFQKHMISEAIEKMQCFVCTRFDIQEFYEGDWNNDLLRLTHTFRASPPVRLTVHPSSQASSGQVSETKSQT